ncbi:MAG: zinc ribbon domain-containing protein [Clostridia bacterium]|nr:zinc ribbon domain-containing protein [Clostridia bacterium]MDD4386627.1 zinc ribbon domain-containing protein [Clostridia bacterium]
MDFMKKINELSKKVGDGVADTYKTVADKSGKLLEEAKGRIAISDKEANIDQAYISMGRTVYDVYSKGEDVGKAFNKECKEIDKINAEIEEMNRAILFNKKLRKCDNCLEIIGIESVYCESCGQKQKAIKVKKAEVKEEVKKEAAVERVCPTCGSISDENAKFCLKCGYKYNL